MYADHVILDDQRLDCAGDAHKCRHCVCCSRVPPLQQGRDRGGHWSIVRRACQPDLLQRSSNCHARQLIMGHRATPTLVDDVNNHERMHAINVQLIPLRASGRWTCPLHFMLNDVLPLLHELHGAETRLHFAGLFLFRL